MLKSEIWSELASTHINVYNVCELTSKHLRTDFYTFANWPETFAKRPLAKHDRLPIHQNIHKAYGMLQMLCDFATSQENGTDGPNDTNMNSEKLNTAI